MRYPLVLPLFLILLTSTSLAGPATPPGTAPSPIAVATGAIAETPWHTARHVDPAAGQLYTAQSLTSARWDVGATQERFWGRPFWIEPVTGRNVRVAIVDTGIDPGHPDLDGSVAAWRDFIHNQPTPYDDDTHGTHVAGIIAAHGHFQYRPNQHYFPLGARGIAPDVDLIVAKAMDRDGDGDATTVADAIRWAIDPNGDGDYRDGADIINLSIGLETPPRDDGGPLPDPITIPGLAPASPQEERVVREAIDLVVRAGAVVVVAAGNHEAGAPQSTVNFPGTLANVITVGAVDPDGRAAMFSNQGAEGSQKPDLMAPGILLSTFPDRVPSDGADYVALGGTSMAAPVVTGTIALMMEADPTLRGLSSTQDLSQRTETIRRVLIDTARPVGQGYNPIYGHGLLRTADAVDAVDQGRGPANWDAIILVLLVVLATIGLLHRHKRQRDLDRRVRLAQAEAAAMEMRQRDDPPGHSQDPPPDPSGPAPAMTTGSRVPEVPDDQRPPWAR